LLAIGCHITLRGRWCDIVLNVHAPTEDNCGDTKDIFYEELERALDQFLKYRMKMLGDSNEKVRREDIFRLTIGDESLHETSNDQGIRVVKVRHIKKSSCHEYNLSTPQNSFIQLNFS
jgi:hypothetical protein